MRTRDAIPSAAWPFTPVQRQLLGLLDEAGPDHAWGHDPAGVPLYELLRQAGQLNPEIAALRA